MNINRCPATFGYRTAKGKVRYERCGAVMEFVGLTVHRLYGWRRWSRCTSPYCGVYVASYAHGATAIVQKAEPPRTAFRSIGLPV